MIIGLNGIPWHHNIRNDWAEFDELFGINTAEERITAELYGRRAVPSNGPENCYLFSSGRGKTARYNSKYLQSIRDKPETEELKAARAAAYIPKTMDELHNQYLNFQVLPAPKDMAFVEAQLKAVAIDTVQWWTEFVRTQPLEGQRRFDHRKDRTEVLEGEAAEHDCKEMEGAD
ncbi:hypothetical protein KCV03_g7011, partial [Aureobasidium melanogenum]